MTPRLSLPGTVEDHRTKRLYLARLAAAHERYEAGMARPRRLLAAAKQRAPRVLRKDGDDAAIEMMTKALTRFARAQERCDRARARRRRQAERWLARQEPGVFRGQSWMRKAAQREARAA